MSIITPNALHSRQLWFFFRYSYSDAYEPTHQLAHGYVPNGFGTLAMQAVAMASQLL